MSYFDLYVRKNKDKNWLKFVINGILALISTCGLVYYIELNTGDVLGIVLFVILWIAYNKYGFSGKISKSKGMSAFFSLCFSVISVMGKKGKSNVSILESLYLQGDTINKSEYLDSYLENSLIINILIMVVCLCGLFIISYFLMLRVFDILGSRENYVLKVQNDWKLNKLFIISIIIILILWLPYYLVHFPGVLSYDSINQLQQILGDIPLNNGHCVVHTFLISCFIQISKFLKIELNYGIGLYILFQMFIMAVIESNTIRVIYKYTKKKELVFFALFYFALPLNAMYSITMWKDILFSGFVLWLTTVIYEIIKNKDDDKIPVQLCIQYIISALLMILFRNNAKIAYIICVPFFIVWVIKKRRKALMGGIVLPIIMAILITGPVYNFLGIEKSNRDIIEELSIPIQHIARVVCEDSNIDLDDRKMIEKLAPLEEIQNTYNCRFADPMKNLMWKYDAGSVIENNKFQYFLLWLRLGIKHPSSYFFSEIDMTVGYWYSAIQYRNIEVGIYPNEYGIHTVLDTNGKIYQNMYKWLNAYKVVPILGVLNSMGAAFLLMLLCFCINCYYNKKQNNIIILPILSIFLTLLLAVPLFAEMRYLYCIMLTVPLFGANILEESLYGNEGKV